MNISKSLKYFGCVPKKYVSDFSNIEDGQIYIFNIRTYHCLKVFYKLLFIRCIIPITYKMYKTYNFYLHIYIVVIISN